MLKFKVGDRVVRVPCMDDYQDDLGRVGTVTKVLLQCGEGYVDVEWDVSKSTDREYNTIGMWQNKFELLKAYNPIQQQRNNEAVKYAEWFKYAIRNINSAGGDPMIFIDKLPPDVIDSMVRNNLFIFYRGKDV